MSQTAIKRLQLELKELVRNPAPLIDARPTDNILTWLFILTGPQGTPYEGGEYLGLLIFPTDYPFKPPAIKMVTPSGRFKTHTRLCFSMSDFHPEDWSPMWGIEKILTGLLSFMTEEASTFGSISTSDTAKRGIAAQSLQFNVDYPDFMRFFPHRYEETMKALKYKKEVEQAAAKHESSRASCGPSLRTSVRTPVTLCAIAVALAGVVLAWFSSHALLD
jgi:ubiquitin-conjugating enzyme E2 J2